jgi:hypothetical protein
MWLETAVTGKAVACAEPKVVWVNLNHWLSHAENMED